MRVLVLGSGVIGVSTAWYLSQAGAEVVVVDRQPDAGLETSFANAGQVSPGYSTPWAAPGIPLKALKWLFQKHAPLAIRLDGTPFQLQWLWQMLRECSADRYAVNKTRMLRLADYSRQCLDLLRAETGIAYEGRQQGTLQVFRDAAQFAAIGKDTQVLNELGIAWELLDANDMARLEPGLDVRGARLAGGLRLPGDQTGDCHLFTRALSQLATAAGVDFRYGQHIDTLLHQGGRVRGARVHGPLGTVSLEADAVVVALGSYSRDWVHPLGLSLPVYPMKGYSLTLPVRRARQAPVSTIMDESHKIAVTRFDDRIRVGGMAEVSGFDLRLDPRRRATLEFVVQNLFPGAGDVAAASFWTGLRPMTPDGTPIVGRTRLPGLWLNTGHGTLGWTMACGSGRLLADLVMGRSPDIPADDLALERYAAAGGASRPRTRSSAPGSGPVLGGSGSRA